MNEIREKAEKALCDFMGEGKKFREGQFEAIEATLTKRRTLVVQRTGWGKSMVYFVCTKLLRDEGKGVTLIISPLLVLMNNQIAAAGNAGLKCEVLNSTKTVEEKNNIIEKMKKNELDIIFTTPETLFTELVQNALSQIKIGLFVIDEAHCISDWGHDFRPDYCRLKKVIKDMPNSVPLLATTATANKLVIADLEEQLGGNVYVSRGHLMRDNLSIQVLNLKSKTERYAWICENVPKLKGSGIIYCLTRNDCDEIADFLVINGISARAYYSDKEDVEETEQLFMNNDIKVIVATVKLGMGYDKGDISFVIHYQTPQSIVAYYQQIGRAGRKIDRAYTFLMHGAEDSNVLEYFRNTAFPTESEAKKVYNYIKNTNGVGLHKFEGALNISSGRIKNTLKFLINEEYICKDNKKYYPSSKAFYYNKKHYDKITKQRENEYDKMLEMMSTDKCFNRIVVNSLDDNAEKNCGICANCLGYEEYPAKVSDSTMKAAADFIEQQYYPIEPRLKWAETSKKITKPNETGICLSRYGHPIYGELVKKGKYETHFFSDKLVEKSVQVLKPFIAEHGITALTYVPSLRSDITYDFANRLAEKLGLPCLTLLKKTDARQQKEMENSIFQCNNALNSFRIVEGAVSPENILLVDDMVDSKWTLTVCGDILTKAGAEHIYPYVLASTSKKEG